MGFEFDVPDFVIILNFLKENKSSYSHQHVLFLSTFHVQVLSRKVKEDTYKNGFSYDAVLSEAELAAKLHTAATRPKFIADPAGEDGGLLGVAAGVENFVEQSKEVYNLCGVGFSEGKSLIFSIDIDAILIIICL